MGIGDLGIGDWGFGVWGVGGGGGAQTAENQPTNTHTTTQKKFFF